MLYTRLRTQSLRSRPVHYSREGYTPTVFYNKYKWTESHQSIGTYKQTMDTPVVKPGIHTARKTKLVKPEPVKASFAKGIDPGAVSSAMDVGMFPNGFSVTRATGKVMMPDWSKTVRVSNGLYIRYEGNNPLTWNTFPVDVENLMTSPNTYFEPVVAKAQYCLAKALEKVNEPLNDYAVPIAELRETLKFLASPIKSLLLLNQKRNLLDTRWVVKKNGGIRLTNAPNRSTWDKLKRREWRKDLRNAPSHVSDFWLSYRYGMEPLVQDCDTVLQHAWHGLYHTRGVFSKRARLIERSTTTKDTTEFSIDPSVKLTCRDTVEIIDTHRAFVVAQRRVMGGYWEEMLDMGFNPFALPAIAWELVPLSFVLDRFVNVGSWISACTYRPDTTYRGNVYSRRRIVRLSRHAIKLSIGGTKVPGMELGTYDFEFDNYVRLSNLAQPKTPVWNHKALDLGQWFDHLTILWQRMPKFVKE